MRIRKESDLFDGVIEGGEILAESSRKRGDLVDVSWKGVILEIDQVLPLP